MRFNRNKRQRRLKNAQRTSLGFESLENRALLSATQTELGAATLAPTIVQNIPHPTIPVALSGKVDGQYWQIASEVSQASQNGSLAGEALHTALVGLNLGGSEATPVNAAGEIRTVIHSVDTTAQTIGLLESAGARLDAGQLGAGGSALADNQLYAWVPAQLASNLAALSVVKSVSLPVNAITDVGSVTTAGDGLLRADLARSILGVDGTGIKVGVISSGVPNRAAAQATGDLPATITIDPTRSGALNDNEGSGMLEIIHDMAPGASLYFSGYKHIGYDLSGNEITQFTASDMVDSINWLISQGVNIIVDDVQFFNEPMFTDGIVALKAADAVAHGVTYVSAAGNRATGHYQGQFSDDGMGFQDFKFGAGLDDILNVTVAPQKTAEAWLNWSDALGSSANDYDISFYDLTTGTFIGTPGTNTQNGVGGDDFPIEVASWTNTSASAVQVGVVVQKVSGVARELEIYLNPNAVAADDDATITDSLFGQKAVDTVISVGAIDVADPGTDTPEAYSSRGPSTIYTGFATQTKLTRNSLDGMGVDGGNTATFGTDISGDADTYPNFFGTSAAAPHVAGIIALLLDLNPSLTPAQVSDFLKFTATDVGTTGYDADTGSGRFDALAAGDAVLTSEGDFNHDGVVNKVDYNTWRANFGNTVSPYFGADGNGNGVIDAADYVVWADAYVHPIGDYNNDGVAGIADYNLWRATFGSTTDLRADGNGNGVVDAADYVVWRETFSSAVGAAKFGVLTDAFGSGLPPKVAGVALSNAGGSGFDFTAVAGSGEQLRSIPLAGANSISITFNQAVTVSSSALTLINLDGTSPSIASFNYDSDSQTATWTFTSSLADGQYLVRLSDSIQNSSGVALDGEFTNPWSLTDTNRSIFASGDGAAGSEFRFRFTVLAGDSNHDNIDGTTDYRNWQSYEPGMIHVSTTTDDYDTDLSFGDVSLREAVNYANNATEPTTIDLPAGQYTLSRSFTEGTGTAENDLDVFGNTTIIGAGAGLSVITTSVTYWTDVRAFEVSGASARLKITGMTLTGAIQNSNNAGGAALVENGGALEIDDCAIVNNQAYYPGAAIRSMGGNVTIMRSVFTGNSDTLDGAIYASDTISYAGSLTIGQSIFALNTPHGSVSNVRATTAVVKTNLGNNLYDSSTGGFFNVVSGTGDYLGTPTYVVTSVADTFDHSDDVESLSIREAIDKANTASGTQEIWTPGWNFTLTRDRGAATTDTDVSIGDLDISDSVIVRGVAGLTEIGWKAGVVDRVFDFLGDYNRDGSVDSGDYVTWRSQNGFTNGPEQFVADGDDDGDVDNDDYNIWSSHYGNTFQKYNLVAIDSLV